MSVSEQSETNKIRVVVCTQGSEGGLELDFLQAVFPEREVRCDQRSVSHQPRVDKAVRTCDAVLLVGGKRETKTV